MNRHLCGVAAAFALAFALPAFAQTLRAELSASPRDPRAGEGFELIVSVIASMESGQSGVVISGTPQIEWPDFGGIGLQRLPGDRTSTQISSVNGRAAAQTRVSCTVAAPREGPYHISPITVRSGSASVKTNSLTLVVSGSAPSVAPVAPVADAGEASPGAIALIVLIGLGAAGALVAAVLLGKRMRPVHHDEGTAEQGSREDEIGERALARLTALVQQGDARPFYSALGALVRQEVGRLLGIDPTGLTTDEFLALCRARLGDEQLLMAVAECLVVADRVKFGAGLVSYADSMRHLELARSLVSANRVRRGRAP